MCTAHVLMRFCHLINRSFVCKAKEGRRIRISDECQQHLRSPNKIRSISDLNQNVLVHIHLFVPNISLEYKI
jgi:hypothetical protein